MMATYLCVASYTPSLSRDRRSMFRRSTRYKVNTTAASKAKVAIGLKCFVGTIDEIVGNGILCDVIALLALHLYQVAIIYL